VDDDDDDDDDNDGVMPLSAGSHVQSTVKWVLYKKLSYRRRTARRTVTVKTVLNVAQMFVELHLISPALGE